VVMYKQKIYKCFYVAALLSLFSVPMVSSASTIYMEVVPSTVAVGDTFVVKVYIDTDTKTANALDGVIATSISNATADVEEISVAGSVLTLWPKTPSFSKSNNRIQFTGGVPGGFVGLRKLLFTIVMKAKNPGSISLIPSNSVLYLNDGKGTATPVTPQTLTFSVVAAQTGVAPRDEWQGVISQDVTPPEQISITEVQDPSVHEGKKHLFFQAIDAQTGIDYYEVVEGTNVPVRSSGVYILQNQTGPTSVTVTAYDKAGNIRVGVYNGTNAKVSIFAVGMSGALLVLGVVGWVLWKRRKRI